MGKTRCSAVWSARLFRFESFHLGVVNFKRNDEIIHENTFYFLFKKDKYMLIHVHLSIDCFHSTILHTSYYRSVLFDRYVSPKSQDQAA